MKGGPKSSLRPFLHRALLGNLKIYFKILECVRTECWQLTLKNNYVATMSDQPLSYIHNINWFSLTVKSG